MRIVALLLILTPALTQADSQPTELFDRAASSFDAGQYGQSARIYDSLLQLGFELPEVYFNLGNAYFRAGDLGRAVWAYRSAAALDPRDPDVEANLTVARLAARDRIETRQPGLIRQAWISLGQLLSLSEGARLVTLLWLGVWFCAALWLLFPAARRLVVPVFKITATLWAAAAIVLLARYVETRNTTAAVVIAAETQALSGPGGDADVVFSGHAGLECVVRGQRGEYLLVELANGRVGWMPVADLKRVGS